MKKVMVFLSFLMVSSLATAQTTEYLVKMQPHTLQRLPIGLLSSVSSVRKIRPDVFVMRLSDKQKQELQLFSGVEHIEPDADLELLSEPNDLSRKLWNLHNDNGVDINAKSAWKITTGSKNVVVALIDSGVDLRHPDLRANLWVNQKEANGISKCTFLKGLCVLLWNVSVYF